MTDATPRLSLPLLAAGQAQKEVLHNEALLILDALTGSMIEEGPINDPPASPSPGQCWLTGAAPTGAWGGQPDAIALRSEGGWRFVVPRPGMLMWLRSHARWLTRDEQGWTGLLAVDGVSVGGVRVVGPQQPAIAAPAGGATVDAEARTAVAAIVAALRAHGLIAA